MNKHAQLLNRIDTFLKIAQMSFGEALEILDLPREVSLDDLKKRYRELVNKLHPDRAKNETERKILNDRLVRINAAYSVAIQEVKSAIPPINEEDEIERRYWARLQEGLFDPEEGYIDPLEEVPREYKARSEQLRQQIISDVKGPRYRKHNMRQAEKMFRSIDWASLFVAYNNLINVTKSLHHLPTIGPVLPHFVSDIEYKIMSEIKRVLRDVQIDHHTLEEAIGKFRSGFTTRLVDLKSLLEKDNEIIKTKNAISDLAQQANSNLDPILEALQHLDSVYKKIGEQYTLFYNIWQDANRHSYLATLPK